MRPIKFLERNYFRRKSATLGLNLKLEIYHVRRNSAILRLMYNLILFWNRHFLMKNARILDWFIASIWKSITFSFTTDYSLLWGVFCLQNSTMFHVKRDSEANYPLGHRLLSMNNAILRLILCSKVYFCRWKNTMRFYRCWNLIKIENVFISLFIVASSSSFGAMFQWSRRTGRRKTDIEHWKRPS